MDLTIVVCNYNTPEHLKTMLKSFVVVHGDGPHNIVLMENSTDGMTEPFLNDNNIEYVKTPGATHSISVDRALLLVRTRYALIVDSDIVFKNNIGKLIDVIKLNNGAILGEVCGNRGGYLLKKRVHPWFCLIDADKIKRYKIKFHDQERINSSGSNPFYGNVPVNHAKHNIAPLYDVGATFFEDINKCGLKIIDAKGISKYYLHFEGSSWHRVSGHNGYENLGNQIYKAFLLEKKNYDNVDVKNKFVFKKSVEDETKILMIQPIFCPNKEMFEINKRSIMSFLNYIDYTHSRNVECVFAGWCKDKKHEVEISDIISAHTGIKSKLVFLEGNYGKAYVVNKMFSETYNDQTYLLTMDSDIIWDFGKHYNNLHRLVKTANNIPSSFNGLEVGMIALNQQDSNCHMEEVLNKSLDVDGETVKWSSKYVGIAGGCLFINAKKFKEIGGYRVMGVYSGDDGFLLADMNAKNYVSVVAKDISIIHPSSNDLYDGRYLNWKHKVLDGCRENNGRRLDDQEIKEKANESIKLWEEEFCGRNT